MTNVEEIGVSSESLLEAKRRRDRERKRAERARNKSAKAAETETLIQAWERHSEKLKHNEPAVYARLAERHQEIADLEFEITDSENFARGSGGAKPYFAECWLDVQREFEERGECNYGAIERREGFHPTGTTYDTSDPYRWFGFQDRLSADCFFRITRAFVSYALKTKDESLDPATVDAAVNEFTKRGFSQREINPGLISLIRVHRGLPANEPPMWEWLRASDGFEQCVPRSIAEAYRNKGIVFKSPAQLERLAEGRRDLE